MYFVADTAVAFSDIRFRIEWSLVFQGNGCCSAVAGTVIHLCILDFDCWLRAYEFVGRVFRFEGCSVISVCYTHQRRSMVLIKEIVSKPVSVE